jgi:putative FmdB family regulatory protein
VPIYPYKCQACDLEIEVIRTLSEDPMPDGTEYSTPCPAGTKQGAHDWVKQMGLTRPHQHAPGFGRGRKGSW